MSIGLLIVNLGTPDSFENADVKKYLHEFLLDKRVINKTWFLRQVLVKGIIVPKRYKESAKSYKEIWTDRGSPLKFYGEDLRDYLQNELEEVEVELAMRYQSPSIKQSIKKLAGKNIRELIVFPLFPQYASATVASIHDELNKHLHLFNYLPKIQFVSHFFDRDFFLDSICEIAKNYSLIDYDHILFSFHGLPQSQLKNIYPSCCKTDNSCCKNLSNSNFHCYSAQCYFTANALAKRLKLQSNKYSVTFQSRLGKDPWLEPFTVDKISQLPQMGAKKVLVFCPSFVCDCLETLYEIGIEYSEIFIEKGGERLDLVEGLNNHPFWMKQFADEVKRISNQKLVIV